MPFRTGLSTPRPGGGRLKEKVESPARPNFRVKRGVLEWKVVCVLGV